MTDDRLMDQEFKPDEIDIEVTLRPSTIDEFIGQTRVKENLRVFIEAALGRKESLDHILLFGPPGLGKTTLAFIIANRMNAKIHQISGPVLERAGDLAGILTNLVSMCAPALFARRAAWMANHMVRPIHR